MPRSSSRRLGAVKPGVGQPLRRAAQPRLDDHLPEVVEADLVELHEDGRVVVEVRRGEEDGRIVGQQRLLGDEVLDAGPEDRSVGRGVAQRLAVRAAQRALPDEELVVDAPLRGAPRLALRGTGEGQRDAPHVVPGGHSASPWHTLPGVTYGTTEARQELLETVADAIKQIGNALAALGEAYELLDENTADRLEEELFGPVQAAYGRAKRTHTALARRSGLPQKTFLPAVTPSASAGVHALVDSAVEGVDSADHILAELQDSLRPVEVGDPELRAGLAEVRTILADVHRRARALESIFGR